MAFCHHCGRRKAKRHCPALRAELCQLCCGELRQKRINCPSSCPYLQHQAYQEQRKWQRFRTQPRETINDERLAWLIAQIEMALYEISQRSKDFTDQEAFRILSQAREKIAAGEKRIILPEERIEKKPEISEALVNLINQVRYEKGLVLSTSSTFSREEKVRCLEALMGLIYETTGGDLSQRVYLEDLARRIEKARKEKINQKIIVP